MAITDIIRSIIAKANTTTGKSDTTVTQAVQSLVDGYGSSSGTPFDFGGMNGTKVATYSYTFKLADTSFVIGSSASTSATNIKASVANQYTTTTSPTIAYGDKDIIIVQRCLVTPTYGSGTANTARQIGYSCEYVSWYSKRKTSDTSGKTTRQLVNTNAYLVKYYNASGTITRSVANYGFYMTPQAPTISSATSSSAYIKCSSPILYYRVNSGYMSSANIKLVTDCDFKWVIDVYTVDAFTSPVSAINNDIDTMLVNGL